MLGVAVVAAVASCVHGYDLVRMHGEFGWTALKVPLTVDGLTYVSSMWCSTPHGGRRPFPCWRGGSSAATGLPSAGNGSPAVGEATLLTAWTTYDSAPRMSGHGEP